ncbi:MAG: DUF1854 domain-containing protein [Pusillimonas sp.]
MTTDLILTQDAMGRLILTHEGRPGPVTAVRNFPITAPDEGISLVNTEGKELAWVARLSDLPANARALVCTDLEQREFTPEIQRILKISSRATPSTWDIETDRGPTRLTLKGEEDIRRLNVSTLLITDSSGVQFLLRNLQGVDRHSRRLLDHFL